MLLVLDSSTTCIDDDGSIVSWLLTGGVVIPAVFAVDSHNGEDRALVLDEISDDDDSGAKAPTTPILVAAREVTAAVAMRW